MAYKVWRIDSLGMPRNHHAIFIETDAQSGGGILLQVTGSIQDGMEFTDQQTGKPQDVDASFIGRTLLGRVAVHDVDRMRAACRGNPPPAKQFDGPRRINPGEKLRRCQEWTAETVEVLRRGGVLRAEADEGAADCVCDDAADKKGKGEDGSAGLGPCESGLRLGAE